MGALIPYFGGKSRLAKNIIARFPEHQCYVEVLAGIKGRFLMTINDTPEVRDIFKRFWIDEVELKYSMSKKEGSRSQIRTELLIGD